MAAQYELLKELLNSGTKLSFGQEFFFKFYQAFILNDRWTQYIKGVGTTLLVTALALALGIVLGSVVALVRVAHDQQRPGHKNPVLGFFNIICEIYTIAFHSRCLADFLLQFIEVETFNNDKVAMIVFAGEAFTQLPITSDYAAEAASQFSGKVYVPDDLEEILLRSNE